MTYSQRFSLHDADPEAYKSMYAREKYVHSGSLDEELLELIKIRASQINNCAHCLAMHTRDARKAGVEARKLDVVSAWHEAPSLYSARECAALALTEQMTLISQHGVSDAVWADVVAHFNEQEIPLLLMAISAINVWNRLAVTTHQDLPDV